MKLPTLTIQRREVAPLAFSFGQLMGCEPVEEDPPLCAFAYEYCFKADAVIDAARQAGLDEHTWLARFAIHALWQERSDKRILIWDASCPGFVRLNVCTNPVILLPQVHAVMTKLPGHIPWGKDECGQVSFELNAATPLAYWQPPSAAVVLWSQKQQCPEKCVRFPEEESGDFVWEGRSYGYLNRIPMILEPSLPTEREQRHVC